jgi:hypothetical protein
MRDLHSDRSDLTDWHSKGKSATQRAFYVEGRQSTRRRGRRLPALKPDYSTRTPSAAERTLYSHPAVVGADHLILHFPQHRKLASSPTILGYTTTRDLTLAV